MFQQEGNDLKPIAYCSRKPTSADEKYAQIEKECLAALWAYERFSRYLVGLHSFKLLTDHKPLVPLMNMQDLDKVPIRCQRMLMRLRGYNFKAEHVPGKHLVVPDTLSRSPLNVSDSSFVAEIACHIESLECRPIADRRLEQIRIATENDGTIQEAIRHTQDGWPKNVNCVRPELKNLFASRSELSILHGLLLYRDRIAIPESLRSEILDSIHEGHFGLAKCRARAQSTVW